VFSGYDNSSRVTSKGADILFQTGTLPSLLGVYPPILVLDNSVRPVRITIFCLVVVLVPAVIVGCSGGEHAGGNQQPTVPTTITVGGPLSVRIGSTAQYTAQFSGVNNTEANWSVSATGASNASAAGTITATGLYTPPPASTLGSVTITATSTANESLTSSITVQLLNPIPELTTGSIAVGSGFTFAITVNGTGFLTGSTLTVGASTVTPATISGSSMSATISMASLQSNQVTLQVNNPNPGAAASNTITTLVPQPAVTMTSATRFLDEATFGPTFSDIAHLQQVGLSAYLDEQFATPPDQQPDVSVWPGSWSKGCGPFPNCDVDGYWTQFATFSQAQLRNRVAFALSKLWTVSYYSTPPEYFPYLLNIFEADAFANWRTLMEDVTLSPAMGNYLNMANNFVQLPSDRPNENFARELMQIFNLGTSRLNQDGTLQLDANGNATPVYTQDQVDAFARAFTGYTYTNDDCSPASGPVTITSGYMPGRMCPMTALESFHDHGAKNLLDGVVLPAGQTAKQDLEGALDDIAQDPNLPPFVSTVLIQNLVESQPSPAYVARVAAVFSDDGTGVRGNMQAVYQAILFDPEARAGDSPNANPTGAGHLRDPLLFSMNILRALNPTQNGDESAFGFFDTYVIPGGVETLHEAPSVFGFYPGSYVIPGTQLLGPEFALEDGPAVDNEIFALTYPVLSNALGLSASGAALTLDLSATGQLGTLASQGVDPLIDALNILFFHANMSSQTRTIFEAALRGLLPEQMVRVGIYLSATSPEYRISQ
jgi:hypothetical protein